MSKLNKLIQELCPDGVEYSSVNDLIKQKIVYTVSASVKLKRNGYLTEGTTPIISQEEEFISGYTNITDKNICQREYVCFGDHSEHVKYVDFAFVQGADGLKIMYCNQDVLFAKYFYYAISNFYKKHCNYERHFKYLQELSIPLPPLPIQEEIVKILDRFAEYTAELQAELQARKEQYEYYHNLLFTNNFAYGSADDKQKIKGNAREEWKWITLGEVCDVYTGGEPPKDTIKGNFQNDINKYPVYGNGKDVYGYSSVYRIDKDATVISSIGANTGAIYFREAFFTPIIRLKVVVPKDNRIVSKFLYYYLSTVSFAVKSSSVPNMNANEVKKLKVPVPPLAEQERIVSILDKFEALVSDLTQGLPAEIAASQERYEYYRDKLLRFERCN